MTRFRPTRYGVIGLYQYADQVFEAEGGRLALRGRNTSGKSKMLELVMPFVLEGDISPTKLDPFSSNAKSMHWNLIGCADKDPTARRNKAVGYVWAEFQHNERDERVTCGIGLQANRDNSEVKRWYFITAEQVGTQLVLCEDDEAELRPLAMRPSIERIEAGGGKVFNTQDEYKDAIRRRLIGFDSRELYEQMLKLIRQLRQPKLSKGLEPDTISRMLSDALPTVEDRQLHGLGDALDRLDQLSGELRGLRQGRDLADALATKTYRRYARAAVGDRAARLRRAENTYENASAAVNDHTADRDEAIRERDAAATAAATARTAFNTIRAEHEALLQSEAYTTVTERDAIRASLEEAESRRDEATEELRADEARLQQAKDDAEGASAKAQEAQDALTVLQGVLADAADRAGIGQHAEAADGVVRGGVHERRERVSAQRRLLGAVVAAADRQRTRAEAEAAADGEVDERRDVHVEAAVGHDAAVADLGTAVVGWRAALVELDREHPDVQTLPELAGSDYEAARQIVQQLWDRAAAELAEQDGVLRAAQDARERERDGLHEREEVLVGERDHGPEQRFAARSSREDRLGAPLWAVVDFADGVGADDRAALEAALEEAGLLDAWISPEGSAVDQDITLLAEASGGVDGPSLADLLVADCGETGIDAEVVRSVLQQIPTAGLVSVAPGWFRAGPVHGRATKGAAQFIGLQARRAHRERLLAAVRERLGEVAVELSGIADRRADLVRRRGDATRERGGFAPDKAVREASEALTRAVDRLADAERFAARARTAREQADEQLRGARTRERQHAEEHHLPGLVEELDAIDEALTTCEMTFRDIVSGRVLLAVREEARESAERDIGAEELAVGQTTTRFGSAQQAVDREQGRLRAADLKLGATDSAEILEQASRIRAEVDRCDQAYAAANKAAGDAQGECGRLEAELDAALLGRAAAEEDRVVAVTGVQALGQARLFTAISGDRALVEDEAAAGTWTLTTALDRIRALPADAVVEPTPEALEQAVNRVATQISELNHQLALHEMEAAQRSQDGLTICEVTRHGRIRPLHDLIGELERDIAHHELLLSEEQGRALGEAVRAEIAEYLRQKIFSVRSTMERRNAAMRRCPTGGGKRLQMRWVVGELEPRDMEAVRLIGDRSVELMSATEREKVFAFIGRRVQHASELIEGERNPDRRRGGVMSAFDYREWFRFDLEVLEPDGSREQLTARKHSQGSGGEQSVLLNVALFASAAALYDLVPEAPRLVALDEAMDGIDPQVRQDVLAALVDLDLDFIATSFDLDPCVRRVPAIGFYELHRDNEEWGVFAQHFVWNGREKTEIIDDDPPLAA